MNKEEFIQQKVSAGVNQAEIEAEWKKFEDRFKEKGYEGDNLTQRVIRKLRSYYIMLDKNPSEDFEGIIIGFKESDYGAERQYKQAIEAYKANPEQAIADELVDGMGNPLKKSGFDKGKPINLAESIERQYIGLFKGKNNKEYVPGILKGKVAWIKSTPDLFSVVKFKAGKGQKSTSTSLIMNISTVTQFVTEKKLNDTEVGTLLKQYYGDSLKSLSALTEYCKERSENDYDSFVIIRGDVFRMVDDPNRTKTDEITGITSQKGNILGLNSKDDNPIMIDCFAAPGLQFNFEDIAQDVVAIGRPFLRKDSEELSMSLWGVYAPKEYHVEKKEYKKPEVQQAAPVKEEKVADEEW